MEWAAGYGFQQIHEAFQGINANLNVPVLGRLLRGPVALWSRINPIGSPPSDRLGSRIARALQEPGNLRNRLTEGIFIPTDSGDHLATLEAALILHHQADEIVGKIKDAVRARKLPKDRPESLIPQAVEEQVITREEAELLKTAERARTAAITVDSFSLAEYLQTAVQASKADQNDGVTTTLG